MSQVTSSNISTGPGHPPQPQSQPGSQTQPTLNYSQNNSQDTTISHDTDRIFTPPESDSEGSNGILNGHASSQESQSQSQLHLLQLSQLAAAQQKINEVDGTVVNGQSKKRMADGVVKHTRSSSSVSPVRVGHSRNTSTVSVASTGSRIGELSAELRTKLSYAMVKVNNGWQGHSIDEVESLASQAASPTSSNSTLHGRHGTSASPRIPIAPTRHRASSNATSPTFHHPSQGRTYESFWREGNAKGSTLTSPISQVPTLAPPAPIQPRQPSQAHPRRSSNARFAPAYLTHPHHASPHTPAQPSPLQTTPGQGTIRTPNVDPILFSPHQNVREQEALETLMFMSSPGNSANVKHAFPPSLPSSQSSQHAQPLQPSQGRGSGRTALPTSRLGTGMEASSQGRKSLPTARPQSHHAPQVKRVGFEKSPGTYGGMDVDDPHGSPYGRGTPRRRTNGSVPRPSLSIPAGLGGSSRPRTALRGDDIERMLDRVAADDSSDSEGEIHLPPSRRTNGPPVGV
ncbi:hypothetical protein F4781DRAFT_266533 [Annulohypoxylon bovei var. microspora]|nr:hypothetical protein F4781DRAFT_266533 [Annulohypoxylon bovei var. microspora]